MNKCMAGVLFLLFLINADSISALLQTIVSKSKTISKNKIFNFVLEVGIESSFKHGVLPQ